MKRASLVTALVCPLLMAGALANGQVFKKIAPLPASLNLWGVTFTSPLDGWIVGEAYTCFKTTNGGQTWSAVSMPNTPPNPGPLYNVTFVTPSIGIISGGGDDIFRTNDGGSTWNRILGYGGSWYHHRFVSSMAGFMGANGALVRTSDAGASWEVRSGYPSCPIIYGMDFLDANTGMVAGNQASSGITGLFKTTDGGVTWQSKYSSSANDVLYLTNEVAIAIDAGTVVRSNDGGEFWFPTGAFLGTGIVDLAKVNSTTAVGVSSGGDIWRTADSGWTWEHVWIGEGDLPSDWSVEFNDSLHGQVVGQGGAIYTSADGGQTWTRINRGIGTEWFGMALWSETKIILAGFHGYVQGSNDGGTHWTPKELDPPTFGRDTLYSDVDTMDANCAYAVGHWGSAARTTDGGETWQLLNSVFNPSYYANAVDFTDAMHGWVTGYDYNSGSAIHTRKTVDGGLTWQAIPGFNNPGADIEFKGQSGWVLAYGYGLMRTTDGGATWTTVLLPGSPSSLSKMSWASSSTGYVSGWDGYVARSTDGGATWTQLNTSQPDFVYLGVFAYGPREVWICGARQGGGNAVVRRSLNSGASWRTWNLPGTYTTPYTLMRTKRYVYVTGYAGETWKLDLLTSIAP